MRILIDALSARGGGGLTYAENCLPLLPKLASSSDTFFVLLSSAYQKELINVLRGSYEILDTELLASGLLRRWKYLQKRVPGLVDKCKIDLVMSVAETGVVSALPCPKLLLVRNPNFFFKPSNRHSLIGDIRSYIYRKTRYPFVKASLEAADCLVFVSDSFRTQVNQVCSLSDKLQRVIYHGLNPMFLNRGRSWSGQPYLLCVSSVVPHKNMECLIRALGILAQKQSRIPKLLIAGEIEDLKYYNFLCAEAARLGISNQVVFLKRVVYRDLVPLYSGACAFILPSTLETFGHPYVEAMASKAPVLASDIPVAREICANAAVFFDPLNYQDLAGKLEMVLRGGEKVDRMREDGFERAKFFSWERTAQELLNLFSELIETKTLAGEQEDYRQYYQTAKGL